MNKSVSVDRVYILDSADVIIALGLKGKITYVTMSYEVYDDIESPQIIKISTKNDEDET